MKKTNPLHRIRGTLSALVIPVAIAGLGLLVGPVDDNPRPLYGVQVIKPFPKPAPPCLRDGKPVPCPRTDKGK